jgi:peroxin-2
MFAIPRLPTLPPSLAPSTYIPAVRALLTRPKTVDYTSIALQPAPLKPGDNASRDAHSGPFADLPLSSCPICHRKRATAPVPIPGTEASASIALPPVDLDGGEDEERIFIPAQTDCWGGCRWCYYCIGTELARHAEGVAATQSVGKTQQARKGKKQETSADEAPKWDCLRCGGGVTRAWRVGAELEPMSLEQKEGTDVGGISGTGEPKQES